MQASKVAVGIKVPFPFCLDGPLNDIIPSGDDAEAALDVEAIEALVSAMVSVFPGLPLLRLWPISTCMAWSGNENFFKMTAKIIIWLQI